MLVTWQRRCGALSAILGLIIGLACGGCLRPANEPQRPDSPVTKVCRTAVTSYAHRLADSFDDAARQLKAGTLNTAVEANSQLKSSNAAARQDAFQPLNELLNDELGGDKWDSKKAQELFQQISRGLRSFP